ncbi:MAG TPA: methyltransferase domain-containing protein [Polyangiaceae bacterium]|nr:methyltransferase domain-containing protein [Polyangiaceae bacterium]
MSMSDALPDDFAGNENFEFAALELAHNYRAALLDEFSPFLRGRVLEVGAGVGHISQDLRKLGAVRSLTAIEPAPHLARAFRQRLPDLELIEGTIDAFQGGGPLDAIVSINVLEHIQDDREELAKYQRLLAARQGYLCLFVPARQEIYAPIDRDFGHHRRYMRPELKRLLEAAGFSLLRLDYFNCIGYFAWWLNFCLLKRRAFDARAVKLFDGTIFPLGHALERAIVRPPIGQSLIAVARAHDTSPASAK